MTASRWDNRERARDRRLYWLELPVRVRVWCHLLEGDGDGEQDRICGLQESGLKMRVPSNSCGEPAKPRGVIPGE